MAPLRNCPQIALMILIRESADSDPAVSGPLQAAGDPGVRPPGAIQS